MKKIVSIIFLLFLFFSANAQSDKSGTIVVKKANCYDIVLQLVGFHNDTLTVSEFNNTFGLSIEIKNCYEPHIYNVLSYDISINQKPPIHIEGPGYRNSIKKMVEGGVVTITNCVVSVSGENLIIKEENGKKTIVDDKKIIVAEKKFYIVPG